MKLKELAIDGLGAHRNIHLGRFADGLSIVYGENRSGKSTTREFVRRTLLGGSPDQLNNGSTGINGRLNVLSGNDEYQLSRDRGTAVELTITPTSHSANAPSIHSLRQLTGELTGDLYDTLFNVSFRETPVNATRLASVLHAYFGVGTGPATAGDDIAYLGWQREQKVRLELIESLNARLEALSREKRDLESKISSDQQAGRAQLAEVESQISVALSRISDLQSQSNTEQLARIEQEIAQLQLIVENPPTQTVLKEEKRIDHFDSIYQRLDEIDNQIRRWRSVQSDIQHQRIRLRDEMVIWNELTLDSDEHPYHNARAILVSLESKVDEAERNAHHWGSAVGPRVDASQMARALGQLCESMREDLYGLCNELSQQYKHIRHRAAANELKQLRRCYAEMGENIQRLVQRREVVIREIRGVDPVGAEAIVRAEAKFCECAQHEGYLAARRRHIGNTPVATSQPTYEVVAQDVTAERNRLAALTQQRADLLAAVGRLEVELAQLNNQHADLVRRRELLQQNLGHHELSGRIQEIESQLPAHHEELRLLKLADHEFVATPANPLIKRACGLLHQMSTGELQQVFLSEPSASVSAPQAIELQVRDQFGKVLNFSAIESSLQDQAYLSLMLAAKEAAAAKGISLPTIIDDAFSRISGDRAGLTLLLLNEFAKQGHQIILFTQHRYLADRVPGVPVFELPEILPTTQSPAMPLATAPVVTTPPIAPVRFVSPSAQPSDIEATWLDGPTYVDNGYPRVPINLDSGARPYPLSKYPRVNAAHTPARDYTVAYPGSGAEQVAKPVNFNRARRENEFRVVADNFGYRDSAQSSPPSISSVPVNAVGDQLGFVSAVDQHTSLSKVGYFDAAQIRAFENGGVHTVGDLLAVNDESTSHFGVHGEQLSRWQSQLWLLTSIPGLRLRDARLLVACGINEPDHLDTSHPQQVLERLTRFLATSEGRRFMGEDEAISLDRINGWYRSLDATRSRWQGRSRRSFQRTSRSHQPRQYAPHDYATRDSRDDGPSNRSYTEANRNYDRQREPRARSYSPRDGQRRDERRPRAERNFDSSDRRSYADREPRVHRESQSERAPRVQREPQLEREHRVDREPQTARAPRMVTPTPETLKSTPKPRQSDPVAEKLKFYLDLSDHIEAAPSIGPKTAERFEKIGVVTVADFLKQTAESMAVKIKYKRISADVIRQWQQQARLVCRIPNLRGHDAQLLVACEVTEPEDLSTMQPKHLFGIIGPFSESKEGQKIIRNGKKPDLAEITDWISWAEHTRSIQAA